MAAEDDIEYIFIGEDRYLEEIIWRGVGWYATPGMGTYQDILGRRRSRSPS